MNQPKSHINLLQGDGINSSKSCCAALTTNVCVEKGM